MDKKFIFLIFTVFATFCSAKNVRKDDNNLPTVSGNYWAISEVTMTDQKGKTSQMILEENNDEDVQKSSLAMTLLGETFLYIQDGDTNEVYRYFSGKCEFVQPKDYDGDDILSIINHQAHSGVLLFPLRELLQITEQSADSNMYKVVAFRNQQARQWTFNFLPKFNATIDVFWKMDETFDMPSASKKVPLGFILTRNFYRNLTDHGGAIVPTNETVKINIVRFHEGVVNKRAFEPPAGAYCNESKSEESFPIPEMKRFHIGSEVINYELKKISNVDMWVDFEDKFMRIDYFPEKQPIIGDKYVKPEPRTIIITKKRSIGYVINPAGTNERTCKVQLLNHIEFDGQLLVEPKDDRVWYFNNFFGLSDAHYKYTSLVVPPVSEKRGIPCGRWQGRRIGKWPFTAGTSTIWEWCIANVDNDTTSSFDFNFHNKAIPLVSLDMYEESTSENNLKLTHNFYDVTQLDGVDTYLNLLDLADCFAQTEKMELRFYFEANDTTRSAIDVTKQRDFLYQMKVYITIISGFETMDLRISNIRSDIAAGKPYTIIFTALDIHDKLPDDEKKKMISLKEGMKNLNETINGGLFGFVYEYKNGTFGPTFNGVKNSLQNFTSGAVRPDRLTTTSTTTTTTTSKPQTPSTPTTPTTKGSTPSTPTSSKSTGTPFTPKPTISTGPTGFTIASTPPTPKPTNEFKDDNEGGNIVPVSTVIGVAFGTLLIGSVIGVGIMLVKAKYWDRTVGADNIALR